MCWLIHYCLFVLPLQTYKPSFLMLHKLPFYHHSSLSIALVMATGVSCIVVAEQHTARSHCPAVTRAHISTGGLPVLYWETHCYATYALLPAAPSGCPLISISLLHLSSCLSAAHFIGHTMVVSGAVKERNITKKKPCQFRSLTSQFYVSRAKRGLKIWISFFEFYISAQAAEAQQ